MKWTVKFHDAFEAEFDELEESVQDELLAQTERLEYLGPSLGRPHVDTLNGSKYSNMKELRFKASRGVWRVAFAYDPNREAILLIAGNKSGVKQQRFYKDLIKKADERYSYHLLSLMQNKRNDHEQNITRKDKETTS